MNRYNPYVLACAFHQSQPVEQKDKLNIRRVRWYELMLITEGEGYLYHDGKNPVMAERGRIVLHYPGMMTTVAPSYSRYIVVFDAIFSENKIPQYQKYYDNYNIYGRMNLKPEALMKAELKSSFVTKNMTLYEQLFREIYGCYLKEGTTDQFYLKSRLMYLLSLIFEEQRLLTQTESCSDRMNRPKIEHLKEFLISNIKDNFSLSELANEVGYSEAFLCRLFKRMEGKTITQFINEQRLLKAKTMLIETDASVQDILMECGFSSENYFYKLFKKTEQVSPKKFRSYNQH